jgi:CheY-like chemotaxis protein
VAQEEGLMKNKVLWIEDGARYDLPYLAAPVYMEGNFDLYVAEDTTEGLRMLQGGEFDAVICDIRLPPGSDPLWVKIYRKAGHDKAASRLGLRLLQTILGESAADARERLGLEWLTPQRIGILTVEEVDDESFRQEMLELGITVYQRKNSSLLETALLDLIQRVLAQQA